MKQQVYSDLEDGISARASGSSSADFTITTDGLKLDKELGGLFLEELIAKIDSDKDEFKKDPIGKLEKFCTPHHLFGSRSGKCSGWLEKIKIKRKGIKEDSKDKDKETMELRERKPACKTRENNTIHLDKELLYVLLISGIITEFEQYEKDDRERRIENYKNDSLIERCNSIYRKSGKTGKKEPNVKLQCHPIWILNALVSEKHLEELETDPMRTALKLGAIIKKKLKEETPSMYTYIDICKRRILDDLNKFVESMMNECVCPEDTELLMNLEDETVLFDLRAGDFRNVICRPEYKKLYQEKVFWRAHVYDSYMGSTWSGLARIFMLAFWNVVYPFAELRKRFSNCSSKSSDCNFTQQFFSPISCFAADLVNLFITFILLNLYTGQLQPNQDSAVALAQQLLKGNVSVEDHPKLKAGSTEGMILIELEKRAPTLIGWALFGCLISRFLIEVNQLCDKRIWSCLTGNLWEWNELSSCQKVIKKARIYFSSATNILDTALLTVLISNQAIEVHYYYASDVVYGEICVNKEGCGNNLEYNLEERRITYMTYACSVALLLSLVRLFSSLFLFVPIIGPILLSIQHMMKDVVKVIVILIFFSIGFSQSLFAILRRYIYVHEASNSLSSMLNQSQSVSENDEDTFAVMKTTSDGILTMFLSFMEGKLTFSEDIYKSKDVTTTVLISCIVAIYFLIFGLLCFNLLIALISKRYEQMTANKRRDWRFGQFKLLVDYLSIDCNGIPFFFPLSILYALYRLMKKSLGLVRTRKDDKKMKNLKKSGKS